MPKYVRASTAAEHISDCLKIPLGELVDVFAGIPAADVVPVVRCKDCKYYSEDCISPHSGWCEQLERGEYNERFCSYGERKDGDTT